MAKAIKRRRGTTEEHKTFVGLDGEITVDTTKKTLVIHDQETVGGFPMASEAMLNESVEKIEEEAEQTFVHKSGDSITGQLNFRNARLAVCNNGIVKGENPSSNKYNEILFSDSSEKVDSTTAIGSVYSRLSSDGSTATIMYSNKNIAGSTEGQSLLIGHKADGSTYTHAPTPPADDNSTQIATTEWVNEKRVFTSVAKVDLNNLTIPGVYYVDVSSQTSLKEEYHYPPSRLSTISNGLLQVFSGNLDGTGYRVWQILSRYGVRDSSTHQVFMRTRYAGTEWSEWFAIITGKYAIFDSNIVPISDKDNTLTLGASSQRWKQLYAGTTTISTSDEREKSNISDIGEALMRAWGKVKFRHFQFNDAIAEKGYKARIHVGVIAQQVIEAFKSEGLDAMRYGIVCYDEWEGEKDENGKEISKSGNRYGIRYEEALALECAYQRWRLEQIEAKLNV